MKQQRAAIEPAQVVAWCVSSMPAEFDAGATSCASVRPGVDALGDESSSQSQGGQASPVESLT